MGGGGGGGVEEVNGGMANMLYSVHHNGEHDCMSARKDDAQLQQKVEPASFQLHR